MKITQLDNFGEGFKIKPRPPHKQPKAVKKLTVAESQLPVMTAIKQRLFNDGYFDIEIFKNDRKKVVNSICRLRGAQGHNIELVKNDSGVLIGYRLIDGQ